MSSQDSSALALPGFHTFANDSITVGDYTLMGDQYILDLSQ